MNSEIGLFNIENITKTFKFLPKVFRMLWSINRRYIILITIFYIINGVLPAVSILSTQLLLNSIQTGTGENFVHILYPLIIYLGINLFGYINSQLNIYFQSLFRIDIDYRINVMILKKIKFLNLVFMA